LVLGAGDAGTAWDALLSKAEGAHGAIGEPIQGTAVLCWFDKLNEQAAVVTGGTDLQGRPLIKNMAERGFAGSVTGERRDFV
jgi:ribosomal protein S6E (S10)